MGKLFQELKRRKVYQIATIYVVTSWVILQVADILFPAFELPDSTIRIPAIILLIGFPLVLIFAWVFELTPEGIKKTQAADPDETVAIRKRDYAFSAVLLVLIGVVTVQQFVIFNRPIGEEFATPIDGMSIAVLPFANLSPDPDNAYFAAGVHEEILNQLAKIGDIQVTSRTTVLRYRDSDLSVPEIARELNVGTILEGSVRFAGNRVAITTQLIRTADDVHLWSETYLRELDDIFVIQADVAKQIANAMQATLSSDEIASIERPATESTEAYTLFLQHRFQEEQVGGPATLDEDGWLKAGIRKMERAVALDPTFARGLAELGWLKMLEGAYRQAEEKNDLFNEALIHANRAIELDPTIARAYVALQRVSFARRQWEEWERHARQSVALPDLDGRAALNFAYTLQSIGQYEESWLWHAAAISKNPSVPFYREFAIRARTSARDYETVLTMAEQYRAVGGDENAYHVIRAYALNRLDRQTESLKEFGEISTERIGGNAVYIPIYHDYLRCQSGEQDSVMEELEELYSNLNLDKELRVRYCAAGAGDIDAIFESYQRIMNLGRNISYNDEIFDEIRTDPRWQQVEDYMDWPDPD